MSLSRSKHVILHKDLGFFTRDTHPPRGLGLHDLPVRGVGDSWKPGLLSSKVGGTAVKETDQQVQEHKVCGEREREREREGERGRQLRQHRTREGSDEMT